MTELIKITDHNGKQAVSARELHTFLESKQQFADWIKNRIKKYEFIEGQDFEVIHSFMKNPEGGRPLDEYALSIDCAKELSMVEGNARGKEARKFFIECEKQLKEKQQLSNLDFSNPDTVLMLAQNWKDEQQKRLQAETQLKEQRPKVLFADAIIASDNSVLIGKLANVLNQNGVNIGQNRLFKWMRENGYLCKFGERYNQPTQYSMDLELFEVSYNTVVQAKKSFQTITTKVTGKGQIYFVEKFLKKSVAIA